MIEYYIIFWVMMWLLGEVVQFTTTETFIITFWIDYFFKDFLDLTIFELFKGIVVFMILPFIIIVSLIKWIFINK